MKRKTNFAGKTAIENRSVSAVSGASGMCERKEGASEQRSDFHFFKKTKFFNIIRSAKKRKKELDNADSDYYYTGKEQGIITLRLFTLPPGASLWGGRSLRSLFFE